MYQLRPSPRCVQQGVPRQGHETLIYVPLVGHIYKSEQFRGMLRPVDSVLLRTWRRLPGQDPFL
jgi:hypothetical protein